MRAPRSSRRQGQPVADDTRRAAGASQNRDAAWMTAALIASQVVVAGIYLLAARASQPQQYGRAVAPLTVAMAIAGIVDFGSNSLVTREIAAARMPESRFARMFFSRTVIVGSASILCTLALVLAGAAGYVAGLPGYVLAATLAQAAVAPLRGRREARRVAAALLSDKFVAAAALLAMMWWGAPSFRVLWLAFVAGSCVSLLAAVALWPPSLRASVRTQGRELSIVNPWASSLHFGLSNVMLSAQLLDVGLVLLVAGEHAAGAFSAVSRWTQPLTFVASGYSQAAYPHAAAAESDRQAWSQLRRGDVVLLPIAAVLVLIAVFAKPLVTLVLGAAYADSVGALRLLMLGALPTLANQPMATFLQSRRYESTSLRALAASIPLQLLTVAVGAYLDGATGAAAGFGVGQLALFVLFSWKVRAATRMPQR